MKYFENIPENKPVNPDDFLPCCSDFNKTNIECYYAVSGIINGPLYLTCKHLESEESCKYFNKEGCVLQNLTYVTELP